MTDGSSFGPPPDLHLDQGRLDAPLGVKRVAHQGGFGQGAGVPGGPVLFPDDASMNATGDRAPVSGAHNWVPTGPRNVGGRVSALAIHPTNPRIMYAGAASGGVHKTIDGGETWFPLWHEQASLAVGGISICTDHPDTVWVATGEPQTGGGEIIRGNGIWRTDDGGASWNNPGVPPVPGGPNNFGFGFEAVAADPGNQDICWAVGASGVFRTMDGGVTWHLFPATAGILFSDVVFSRDGADLRLYLFMVGHGRGNVGIVIRLDDPRQPDAAINPLLDEGFPPAALPNTFTTFPLTDPCSRGKLAIGVDNRNIGYARLTTGENHLGVFRCTNLLAPPATPKPWARLTDHPDWTANDLAGNRIEGQGTYNLTIAVSPRNADHVATGMIDLYVSTNATAANPDWVRATAMELYHLDRAHHEDQHATVFDPVADPPPLWIGHDGGIAVSDDWHRNPVDSYPAKTPLNPTVLPLPANVITWRRRSHGLQAAQMYDVTQSQLVPSLHGCGFQDNGVHISTGSGSWTLVMTADGGFVAFDPDDPYRFLATWQEGVASVEFPGRLAGTLPAPGQPIRGDLWPRILDLGFLPTDGPPFVSELVHHPRTGGRVLHSRTNRVYGKRRDGPDHGWDVEPVGRSLELIADPIFATERAELSVLAAPANDASTKLGFEPTTDVAVAGAPRSNRARIRSVRPGPYVLAAGDQLRLRVNGVDRTITFNPGQAIPNLASATVAEVCAEINAQLTQAPPITDLRAEPVLWPRPSIVEIATTALNQPGAPAAITLGGSALQTMLLSPGRYEGPIGHPTVIQIPVFQFGQFLDLTAFAPPPPQLDLDITVHPGPARNVAFTGPPFADVASLRAGELAHQLSLLLANDPVTVRAVANNRGVRLTPNAGAQLRFDNTAAANLGLPANAGASTAGSAAITGVRSLDSFGGPPLRLRIRDGAAQRTIVFDGRHNFADIQNVQPTELQRVLAAEVAAAGLNVRVDTDVDLVDGEATEITFSAADPDRVWIGGVDGTLYRSDDAGQRWDPVPTNHRLTDQDRRVEAIAFHPTESDVVYVGMYGERKDLANRPNQPLFLGTGPRDPGFLFRTDDGGVTWNHVGADIHDAAGSLVGINAIEVDPGDPDVVYAATNIGVFRSGNRGDAWVPFNQGLPNVWIRDLAFEPQTRMLKAGAWGRAVYERHVGTVPASDVWLHLRASDLDTGLTRPVPRGPDLLASTPTATGLDQSPAIKVNRARPVGIGADEWIDGVEFDEVLEHEGVRPGPTTVFVQVSNRGSFAATGVRVVALWSAAVDKPPPLPDSFWTDHQAGTLPAGPHGEWTLFHDAEIQGGPDDDHDRVTAAYPRIVGLDLELPPDVVDHPAIGILVLVDCADDPHDSAETDLALLLDTNRRSAYREVPVVVEVDEQRLFLVGTDGRTATTFDLQAPAAGPSALGPLGLAAGNGLRSALGGREPFALGGGGADRGLTMVVPPQDVRISFDSTAIPRIETRGTAANMRLNEQAYAVAVADVINQAFVRDGVTARAVLTGAALAFATRVQIEGTGAAAVEIIGGSAAGPLGLATGGGPQANVRSGTQTPQGFDLRNAPHDLTIRVSVNHTIRFPQAAQSAVQVRQHINQDLGRLLIPIRAVVPTVALRVERSASDGPGEPAVTGRATLADIVASPDPVAEPDRPALFALTTVHAPDPLRVGSNRLYVRVSNAGDAPQTGARLRLFEVTLPADPAQSHGVAELDDQTLDLDANDRVIVEATWTPTDAEVGQARVVLAVVDHEADRPVVVPASFESFDDLHRYCRRVPGAASRVFDIA